MKKFTSIMIAAVALLLMLHAVSWAGSMADAKAFIKAGMYEKAAAELETVINGDPTTKQKANPTNAEAHFLLGQCYLKLKNPKAADERFSSAIKLDKGFGYEVATLYKDAGFDFMKRKIFITADEMFKMAMKHDSRVKKEIVAGLINIGQKEISEDAFILATSYDPSQKATVGDFYWNTAENTPKNSNGYWDFKALAKHYNPAAYEKTVISQAEKQAREDLDQAKHEAKIPDEPGSKYHEKATKEFKASAIERFNLAGKNGKAIVEGELPEKQVYGVGKYNFSLKAGEQTPFWIVFSVHNHNLSISSSDYNYEIVYDDGQRVKDGPNVVLPKKDHVKFRIYARSDQEVTMVVK